MKMRKELSSSLIEVRRTKVEQVVSVHRCFHSMNCVAAFVSLSVFSKYKADWEIVAVKSVMRFLEGTYLEAIAMI